MNLVVAGITLRGMVGRKRALLLLALPLTLLVLAVTFRLTGVDSAQNTAQLLQRYGLGTLLPLVALIAGTGVLSPEIDDGTIVFLLSKPVPRPAILHAKLAVAAGLTWLVVAVPMGISGLILVGTAGGLTAGFVVGTLAGALAYCAIFLLITVVSRHAVVLGLIYALVWESLIGGYVPGARELSVQQWSLTVAAAFTHGGLLQTSVGLPAAIGLLAATAVLASLLAGQRLRSLSIPGEV